MEASFFPAAGVPHGLAPLGSLQLSCKSMPNPSGGPPVRWEPFLNHLILLEVVIDACCVPVNACLPTDPARAQRSESGELGLRGAKRLS
jgi:hypothetical protein